MRRKILTVVGARPQFVKAALLSRALGQQKIPEVMVHTGQHFDANMSDVFFQDLDMPAVAHHLGIGGGTHAENTGRMLELLERVIVAEAPRWVVVYGDTDSTLAGALAAAKLQLPVAHVEAGLRSFNREMPEEINRVLTDHASTLLFAPTAAAVENLRHEGIDGAAVRLVGDIMYDAALFFGARAAQRSSILEAARVGTGEYVLLTVHRPWNTDVRQRLEELIRTLGASPSPVVWPMHPRARRRISEFGIAIPDNVRVLEPVGYLDMVMLERNARLIVTDSGGVQKEAYFHRVPCVTLREETEWVELVRLGCNHLAGDDTNRLRALLAAPPAFPRGDAGTMYGEGDTAQKIAGALNE